MVDLQSSMMLWIPVNDKSLESTDELIHKVTVANGAVLDFCDGVMSLDCSLEIIDDCGADIDNYLADLEETIRFLGG